MNTVLAPRAGTYSVSRRQRRFVMRNSLKCREISIQLIGDVMSISREVALIHLMTTRQDWFR